MGQTPLSRLVVDALQEAKNRTGPDRPVDTRTLLVALMRLDTAGEWHRIWLDLTSQAEVVAAPVQDPQQQQQPTSAVRGWLLTASCARAIQLAVTVAQTYDMGEVSAGAVTIGLVSDPTNAAAHAVLGRDGGRHAELLAAVQEAIVGGTLDGLTEVIRTGGQPPPRGPETTAMDTARGQFDRIDGRLGGPDELARHDSLSIVQAALAELADDAFRELTARMLLDGEAIEQVRPLVRHLDPGTAAAVVAGARDRFDTRYPDAHQLLIAATVRPAPAVRKALWLLGFPAEELALPRPTPKRATAPTTRASPTGRSRSPSWTWCSRRSPARWWCAQWRTATTGGSCPSRPSRGWPAATCRRLSSCVPGPLAITPACSSAVRSIHSAAAWSGLRNVRCADGIAASGTGRSSVGWC